MRIQLICAALFLTGTALAQNPFQGFLYNWDRPQLASGISYVVRNGTAAHQVLCRVDRDDYREWGLNGATPPMIQVQGVMLWIQDQNDTTVEQFSAVGYNEDPARANFPLLTTPVMNVQNLPMPPQMTPPGPRFWRVGFNFTQPSMFNPAGDVFLGIGLPAMPSATPQDGLFLGVASTNPLTPTAVDQPGPTGQFGTGTIAQGSYACFVINTVTAPPGTAVYATPSATSLDHPAVDWVLSGGTVGGVALTETNQTTYVSSNSPGGTSNFISGLHPDINGSNPGRADNIGFAITAHTTQLAIGSPAFILMALGPSPIGSLGIRTFQAANNPSSFGNVCIDFTTATTFLGILGAPGLNGVNGMTETQIMIQLSPQTRAAVNTWGGALDLWWQGFAFDPTNTGPNLEIRATGCVIQHLR